MSPDAKLPHDESHAAPARTILPDEAALRRAFDQHADSVAVHAATELGDSAHLTPKVVEHVFLDAWRSRDRLTSEAALVTFLDDAVRHDSARVLSRRMAAQRLGSGVHDRPRAAHHTEADTYERETSWTRLIREIHGSDADEAHVRAAAIAHHEAALHIAEVGHDRGWLRPTLTAVGVVACAFGGIWLLDYASRGAKLDAAVSSASARTVEASPAQIGAVTLDDGSQVRFAPESRVFIPQEFGEDLRGIRVEGTASIRVAPGMSAPLVVKARGTTITAKGTAFIVRAYADDSVTVVALQEGRVTIRRGDDERELAPGHAVAIPDSGVIRAPSAAELEAATAWTRNRLEIRDRRLADVLPEFRRWYNMQIFAVDTRILDRPVTISASLDSVRQAIAAVEDAASVQFGYLDDKMVFRDAGTAGTRP